jgi:hypothetical protein
MSKSTTAPKTRTKSTESTSAITNPDGGPVNAADSRASSESDASPTSGNAIDTATERTRMGKERKPRAPRSIEGDLNAVHARYSKDLPKLVDEQTQLEGKLAEVKQRRTTIETRLHKIEQVMRDNPTLPGLDSNSPPAAPHIAQASAAPDTLAAASSAATGASAFDDQRASPDSSLTGTASSSGYDPTRYVPPENHGEPESTPGDLDPNAPIPSELAPSAT